MTDADNTFTQATDNLIELYRNLERKTLDLPLITITPFLNFLWASFRASFFSCRWYLSHHSNELNNTHQKPLPGTLAI
jgi:hypothetical protein